jgi:hypothetical protein
MLLVFFIRLACEFLAYFSLCLASSTVLLFLRLDFYLFISPVFNQVGKLRTSSHLQLWPGQDKAKQFDTYNDTELHLE